MNWLVPILVVGAFLVFFGLKRMSFVSAEAARTYLREGALVIDVRSAEEFRGGHLASALNIPLGELHGSLPRAVPDKTQVLLLHCLSGGRSAIAKHQAKGLGYTRVFNLGGYRRAATIVGCESSSNGTSSPGPEEKPS